MPENHLKTNIIKLAKLNQYQMQVKLKTNLCDKVTLKFQSKESTFQKNYLKWPDFFL